MDTVHECDRQTDRRTDRQTDRITITNIVFEEQRFVEGYRWPKNGSVPSRNKKRRRNLKFVTDRQTDRQTEAIVDNNDS